MQPVQECLCRAVLFQGFVVTSFLNAYHIFIAFKAYHHENTRQVSLEIISRIVDLVEIIHMYK